MNIVLSLLLSSSRIFLLYEYSIFAVTEIIRFLFHFHLPLAILDLYKIASAILLRCALDAIRH